jgi:hypothetical protein
MIRSDASFYGKELSTSRSIPELENHSYSTVRDCLFNVLTDTHYIGGRSSIRNLRTSHAVVTRTHFPQTECHTDSNIYH